jgi:hypothetical protein
MKLEFLLLLLAIIPLVATLGVLVLGLPRHHGIKEF